MRQQQHCLYSQPSSRLLVLVLLVILITCSSVAQAASSHADGEALLQLQADSSRSLLQTEAKPGLSSLTKGLIGAGVGLGGLMGLAAATMFFLRHRKHRDNSNNIGSSSSSGDKGELVSHDLARVHDSVIVTKQKKRVSTGQQQPVLIAASTGPGATADGPRESPDLRMVTFASGPEGAGLAEDDKQRLRAACIQDSVVIIRSKLASGGQQQLGASLSSHKLNADGGTGSGSSSSACSSGHGSATPPGGGAGAGGVNQRGQVLQQSPSKRVSFQGPARTVQLPEEA